MKAPTPSPGGMDVEGDEEEEEEFKREVLIIRATPDGLNLCISTVVDPQQFYLLDVTTSQSKPPVDELTPEGEIRICNEVIIPYSATPAFCSASPSSSSSSFLEVDDASTPCDFRGQISPPTSSYEEGNNENIDSNKAFDSVEPRLLSLASISTAIKNDAPTIQSSFMEEDHCRSQSQGQAPERSLDTLAAVAEKIREEMLREERVEKEKQAEEQKRHQCDVVQGHNQGQGQRSLQGNGQRSLLTKEQRSALKAAYIDNPSPDIVGLDRLVTSVGLPRRVVQVWFQNKRARDRQKRRSYRQTPDKVRPPSDESLPSRGLDEPTGGTTVVTINDQAQEPSAFQADLKPTPAGSSRGSNDQSEPLDLSKRPLAPLLSPALDLRVLSTSPGSSDVPPTSEVPPEDESLQLTTSVSHVEALSTVQEGSGQGGSATFQEVPVQVDPVLSRKRSLETTPLSFQVRICSSLPAHYSLIISS